MGTLVLPKVSTAHNLICLVPRKLTYKMLGAKTAAFATAAALAVVQTRAESAAHLRVRVHSKVTCPSGQESIGVAGWSSDGCVTSGNVCVANTNGACPSGAHCEWLDTGVYGCADGAPESSSWTGCSGSEQTIGVVGWTHDGCITSSNVCVAQVSNGDCPSGSSCQKLDTGVYGCVASAKKRHHKSHHKSTATCPSGQESIGVAGWSSDGCVTSGNVCVANTNGACPTGAHCAWLDTGVYGCKDGAPEASSWAGCSGSEQTIGVVGWDHDGCITSSNVCVAQVSNGDCPAGAYCSLLDTGVYGCVATSKKHHRHHHHKSNQKSSATCPSGQESIGVAGWSSDGCVTSGNVCVANVNGECPTGAHCEWLDTGVYSCADGAPANETSNSTGCSGSEQTIGVVGWDHDGCIDSANVCVAQVSNGDCPEGAYCSKLDTGVYGCVASSKH
ncbi:hypothetical protein PF005_g24717 [Phytophthora fragariae]|uniref:Uncharacterized protein n=2 Tax=Phytophthora fragariae TaxID=53985 RepID=A0A6A3W5P8_9STRA|nr:hypothetical protein PF009_g25467 [Phytophthora fragariae]KAE8978095.1 hypothetical protein PF011_g23389 [Phytophthora fragariae]KAE9076448.1 hypothetical protein PF007_g24623 [Phytophthora fragariae]KAE9079092.1 hypothetical protein PF006_g27587 [Phytophthora fragariae]KAE9171059.1 hypothetical protein PF002_g29926 [Phytophthora fragariae]